MTTSGYDSAGRLAQVSNAHGSRSIGYDGNGERGSRPTSLSVSGVGTFTAGYGADGVLVAQGLPGAVTGTTVRDAAGDPVSLTYRKRAADGSSSEWLRSTATITGLGQVDSYRIVSATGTARTSRYGYDMLGRLTTATDTTTVDAGGLPAGAACTRAYTFDVNTNRTGLTQTATSGAPAGTCPTSTADSDSYRYDTADRLQPGPAGSPRAALRYDPLGRTRTLPAVDTADRGGDLTLDFYVDDLVASITQNGRSSTFGLDPAARRTVRTDTDTAAPGLTRRTTSYYSGEGDNPDAVSEPDTTITRNITGFGGLAATVTGNGTPSALVTLQLANLHGDITASMPVTATSPTELTVTETTEYGQLRTPPAAGTTLPRYGWLGSHQRDTSTPGGLTLMGARLYAPALGRFLTVDPVEGGSCSDYDYVCGDPVGQRDLDGQFCWRCVGKVAVIGVGVVGALACGASVVCAVAVGVATGAASYAVSNAATPEFQWRDLAREAAIGGALGGAEGRWGQALSWRVGRELSLGNVRVSLGNVRALKKSGRPHLAARLPHFHRKTARWGKNRHRPWETLFRRWF